MSAMTVRSLEPADAPWAADLMEDRRQLYARYSPVFWHPASGITNLLRDDGLRVAAGGVELTAVHTPGHSPGGCCFYDGSATVFSGDTQGWARQHQPQLQRLPDHHRVDPFHAARASPGGRSAAGPRRDHHHRPQT